MSQVRDDSTDTNDYSFLDEVVKKGDGNLANIGTYLAVYENLDNLATDGKGIVADQNFSITIERDKDIYVDDEFLKSLDDRKTEIAREEAENPDRIQERTNHREVVYGEISADDRKRVRKGETTVRELREKGKTEQNGLLDGSFGGKDTGHEFICSLLDDFKENADYETSEDNNTISSKTSFNKREGGENKMTKEANEYTEEIYDKFEDLETAIERTDVHTAKRAVEEVESLIYSFTEDLDSTQEAFQKYDEKMRDHMSNWTDQLDEYQSKMDQRNMDAHDTSRILTGLQRELESYELDERTEELIDIADEL